MYRSDLHGNATSCTKVGLRNRGNMCYANSAIQVLYACDRFRTKIIESQPTSDQKLTSELRKVFAKLCKSKEGYIDPSDFSQVATPGWFTPGRQQDSSEFMRHVLNQISEEEKLSCSRSTLNELFAIKLKNTYTCKSCHAYQEGTDKRLDLVLSFPPANESNYDSHLTHSFISPSNYYTNNTSRDSVGQAMAGWQFTRPTPNITSRLQNRTHSLEELLDAFLSKEDIRYHCECCRKEQNCIRQTDITHYPPYLVFVLGRFAVNKYGVSKVMDIVNYPDELNLPRGKHYRLKAVVIHEGSTPSVGHYTCCTQHPDGMWYKFDDSSVKYQGKVPPVLTDTYATPFMLVYTTERFVESTGTLPKDLEDFVRDSGRTTISQHDYKVSESGRNIAATNQAADFDIHLQHAAYEVGSNWKVLAELLHIHSLIGEIERTCKEPQLACYTLLKKWKMASYYTEKELREKLEKAMQLLSTKKQVESARNSKPLKEERHHIKCTDVRNDAEIRRIVESEGRRWKELAKKLKVRDWEISSIERTNEGKNKAACYKMLKTWISQTTVRNKENELNKALQELAREHSTVSIPKESHDSPIKKQDVMNPGVRSTIEKTKVSTSQQYEDDTAERITSLYWDDAKGLIYEAETYNLTEHPVVVKCLHGILEKTNSAERGPADNITTKASLEERMKKLHHKNEEIEKIVRNCTTVLELEKKAEMMNISDHPVVMNRKAELKGIRSRPW